MARKKKSEAPEAEAQAPNLTLSQPGVPASPEDKPESPRRVRTINGMTIIDN